LDIHISPDDRTLNWFYVDLPDGEKGLLYFWIGDWLLPFYCSKLPARGTRTRCLNYEKIID